MSIESINADPATVDPHIKPHIDPVRSNTRTRQRNWPDHATVWRWHFYAGLFCIPFVTILSISGTIFLFRPQIEAWLERDYDRLEMKTESISVAEQVRIACQSAGGQLAFVEVRSEPATQPSRLSATRVIVQAKQDRTRVYVDPTDGTVLGAVSEQDRFIRWIRRLHGELLLGKRGSYLVEIAASWTIIMIVTGLVLWMPAKAKLAGVVYPRLNATGKVFWKDLHSVIGFWASGLIVFLIATGLPWSTFWGDYFKTMRKVTGTSVAVQSWDGGHQRTAAHHGPEAMHEDHDQDHQWISHVDSVCSFAKQLDWLPPVTVQPPNDGTSIWTIKSETANRPARQSIRYDAEKEQVIQHETFADKHWIDRMVGQGIALHEGQRFLGYTFGWLNQLLALLTTTALMILSLSGLVLWQRRRTRQVITKLETNSSETRSPFDLHPPAAAVKLRTQTFSMRRSWAVIATGLLLAIYLPLFGLTAIVVILVDYLNQFRRNHYGQPYQETR